MSDDKKDRKRGVRLDWRDYMALVIAALQTILLPFVVLMIVLLFLLFLVAR